MFVYVFFFFKQKTAYEMRISDWSSDVCSSDLSEAGLASHFLERHVGQRPARPERLDGGPRERLDDARGESQILDHRLLERAGEQLGHADQIGRASCRARVCQYG